MFITLLLKNIFILLRNLILIKNIFTNKIIKKNIFILIIILYINIYTTSNITYCESLNENIGIDEEDLILKESLKKKIKIAIIFTLITASTLVIIYLFMNNNGGSDGFNFTENAESINNISKSNISHEPYVHADPKSFMVGLQGKYINPEWNRHNKIIQDIFNQKIDYSKYFK